MPYFFAKFSAVIAIGMLLYESVSAFQSESSKRDVWPKLKPLRAPRTTCGAWLMFSVPPASA